MAASFIVSFDCEGKWGFADNIPENVLRLSNSELTSAYTTLLDILRRNKISATFGFVAAYCLGIEDYDRLRNWFSPEDEFQAKWLSLFNEEIQRGVTDGWFNPSAIKAVMASAKHEIASHGFTHRPLSETLSDRRVFHSEMQKSQEIFSELIGPCKTLIYLRNMIGHTDLLKKYGFEGYRAALRHDKSKLTRAKSLVSELFAAKAQKWPNRNSIEIPPGYFLNHRSGSRKLVPFSLSVRRWKHIIDDAIESQGVAHLWSHPHNFNTGDQMFELFDQILEYAACKIRNGDLENLTQIEFITRLKDSTSTQQF